MEIHRNRIFIKFLDFEILYTSSLCYSGPPLGISTTVIAWLNAYLKSTYLDQALSQVCDTTFSPAEQLTESLPPLYSGGRQPGLSR